MKAIVFSCPAGFAALPDVKRNLKKVQISPEQKLEKLIEVRGI